MNEPTETEMNLMKTFCHGYVLALVANDQVYDGLDEWYSYNDKWDINFFALDSRTIHATAHPQYVDEDGFVNTDWTVWVRVAEFDFKGTPKRKAPTRSTKQPNRKIKQ